jgi:pimeloyl-ACP methyl ester carboxylesterase
MGGAVALRLAADEPPKVRSLVLVGSVGPHVDRGELAQELRQGRNPLLAQSAEEFRALLDFVFAKPVKLPPVVGHYVLRKRIARYPVERELFDGWVTSMEGEGGLPRQWDKIVAPALVVHGDRDRVIPLDTAQALAEQLPHARLALLGDVGHLPHVEVPRRVAELVREFYERAG